MKSTKQATAAKQVQIIARYTLKANGHVVYKVRSSNGADSYCTTFVDGKATGCSCPATKPCYHMTQLQAREDVRNQDSNESARKAAIFQVFKSAYDVRNQPIILKAEAILAAKRAASEAYLAKMDEEVAERIASEKAAPVMPKSDQGRLASIMDEVPARLKAPLNGNREFSLTK